MQGLASSTKKAWDEASKKTRAFAVGGLIAAASLLSAAVHALGVDFLIGVANEKILEVVGPLVPAVGQVIASYLFSFATACGVIWFAASWGYWLALHHPVPIPKAPEQTTQAQEVTNSAQLSLPTRQRIALGAAQQIASKLAYLSKQISSYHDRTAGIRQLEESRPEIQANLKLIAQIGFPQPEFKRIDPFEVDHILAYLKEVIPWMERGLYPDAAQRAADETNRINSLLSARANKPKPA